MNLLKILDLLKIDYVLPNIEAENQEEALGEMAAKAAEDLGIDANDLVKALLDREKTRPTALERTGVAIPHARLPGISRFVVVFAASRHGIDFRAEDGRPSHLFFLIVGPEEAPGDYLRLLARIARLCHDRDFRQRLSDATTAREILDIITEQDGKY